MQMIIRRHRILFGDLLIIFISAWLSFLLRLGSGLLLQEFAATAWLFSGISLIIKPIVFQLFGIYRIFWKYFGAREIFKIVAGSLVSSVVMVLVLLVAIEAGAPPQFPRAVIGIDWVLTTVLIFVYRRLAYR